MPQGNINGDLASHGHIAGILTIGAGGTNDYEELENKPSINNIELIGDVSDEDLNIDYNHLINKPVIPQPYTPINYSTTEQNTGVKWIDGKVIYQRTFVFENYISCASSTWTSTGINVASNFIDNIIRCVGKQDQLCCELTATSSGAADVRIMSMRSPSQSINIITLQYTKVE